VTPIKAKIEQKPTEQPPQVIPTKTEINKTQATTTTTVEEKSAQTVAAAMVAPTQAKAKSKKKQAKVEEKPAEALVVAVVPKEEAKVTPPTKVKGKKKQAKVAAAQDSVAAVVMPADETKPAPLKAKSKKKKQANLAAQPLATTMPKEEEKPVEQAKPASNPVPSPTKKSGVDPNRFARLERNPILLYVSAEKYPAHSQRFFDLKTQELWILQNVKGQSFEKGAFYAVVQEQGNILGVQRVRQPDVIEVAPLADFFFSYVEREKEASNLVLLGIVTSVEEQRIVPLRHSATPVAMREYTADFQSASNSRYRIPITVWGALSNAVFDVGTPILLLNAKQSSYQELPRFSVGDSSAILKLPSTNVQVKKLCKFLQTASGEVAPVLPEGILPFVAEDAATPENNEVTKEEEAQQPAKKKQKIGKAEGKAKKKKKKNATTA